MLDLGSRKGSKWSEKATPEQIINKLREAEVLLSQGVTMGEASRKIGVTEQTYSVEGLRSSARRLAGDSFRAVKGCGQPCSQSHTSG